MFTFLLLAVLWFSLINARPVRAFSAFERILLLFRKSEIINGRYRAVVGGNSTSVGRDCVVETVGFVVRGRIWEIIIWWNVRFFNH